MITRTHHHEATTSTVLYSDCQRYRYALTRAWDQARPNIAFVMLNPSKADEVANDPTVERCERRARALGAGAFRVCNIFAWRETDPFKMRCASAPIGPDNDAILKDACVWADSTICAWGTHGAHKDRGRQVEAALRELGKPLYHLGLTKAGHPKHPLYIAYATQPMLWERP